MITLVDSSLRDGMHSVRHSFSPEQVAAVAAGLDRAGVDAIEVSHGDGVGGSSIQYGRSVFPDAALIEAAAGAVSQARIAALLLPGIGTLRRLREAQALGASIARIATHCTEADIAEQHIAWAASHGMTAVGFLMMSHMIEPAELATQARLMESYGASVVYIVDSAGALVPNTAAARVAALRSELRAETAVGFHAHNNLGCGVGNALAAADAGASWLDGSLRGLGAGAGNAQLEVLAAALERSGHETRAELFPLMDVAEEVVAELMERPQIIDRTALSIGYAGVYSSFLLHAERAAAKFGVEPRDVLMELGRRRIVGGQEDMIIDAAAELAEQRG
ncbi:4-hydroxy-2-oxovalerate aldolase [Conexibacter sp. JD483]|uniref:4-hydroxy-2-oxovalerate aldolase n=1 Tax=unclassified Conexibacter TaxID=2627773 RepID=UPI00271F8803|nr:MULTISPECIES: 4-hydroxy-2-oxovalerate aldolase [unclassified Conexibacter]MDO8188401.1 4-hydroxy-2-oxovalerate aldolase [Conexibacter sp. CPCC 205706]MDO8198188.1 4-hydroxy-2-oxovalerate aldolase [Conexibacter sp. CPCC 205762]MDR9370676.1 4-hydroxy-2-oxovalerate aldolase [Conexibacter sp. JD483]